MHISVLVHILWGDLEWIVGLLFCFIWIHKLVVLVLVVVGGAAAAAGLVYSFELRQ